MQFSVIDNQSGDVVYSRHLTANEKVGGGNHWVKYRNEFEEQLDEDMSITLDQPGCRIPNGTHTLYLHDESHDIFAGIAWDSIEAYAEFE